MPTLAWLWGRSIANSALGMQGDFLLHLAFPSHMGICDRWPYFQDFSWDAYEEGLEATVVVPEEFRQAPAFTGLRSLVSRDPSTKGSGSFLPALEVHQGLLLPRRYGQNTSGFPVSGPLRVMLEEVSWWGWVTWLLSRRVTLTHRRSKPGRGSPFTTTLRVRLEALMCVHYRWWISRSRHYCEEAGSADGECEEGVQ